MKNSKKTGIIIQARFSSTRFPGKLFAPFFQEDRLIDVFLKGILKETGNDIPIVLATSLNQKDSIFEKIARQYNIKFFQGSEDDVLQRIIEAAEKYHIETIIRVCADNPIYDIKGTLKLLNYHFNQSADYTAYALANNLPSIKSHLGFWGEVVNLNTLKKVVNLTDEKLYHEHVTNYIYENPDIFKVNLIKAPEFLFQRNDLRFTVDTEIDLDNVKKIYAKLMEEKKEVTIENLVKYVDGDDSSLKVMKAQIKKYIK